MSKVVAAGRRRRSQEVEELRPHLEPRQLHQRPRALQADYRQHHPGVLLQWLEENPGLRISLLHLDVDLYEPTLAALKAFYPRVVTGGVVIFDEYGLMPWEGESQAVDEYFASIGERPLIKKFPTFHNPHGYMIKS
nr:hypothetical protein [Deltaproteobacteria bacterium]